MSCALSSTLTRSVSKDDNDKQIRPPLLLKTVHNTVYPEAEVRKKRNLEKKTTE